MATRAGVQHAEDAMRHASEALERTEADYAFWMRQYKRQTKDVRDWMDEAAVTVEETTPRYRILQQALTDTKHGLDCAARSSTEARQELASARQFYLNVFCATPLSSVVSTAGVNANANGTIASPVVPPPARASRATPFPVVNVASATKSGPYQTNVAPMEMAPEHGVSVSVSAPASAPPSAASQPSAVASGSGTEVMHRQTDTTSAPVAPTRPSSAGSEADAGGPTVSHGDPGPTPGVMLSPLKRRRGREQLYLVPAKRSKYAKAFEWNDTDGKTMHHFPKDMELPVCNLAAMWALWLCGDPRSKHPPYRILTPPDLLAGRARRSLSTLRFVMLEIESRVLAKGAWVSSPNPEDAAGMLAKVKTSLAVRPNKNRGSLQPVELLQWTSMGRIIRDQKKLEADEEEDEE